VDARAGLGIAGVHGARLPIVTWCRDVGAYSLDTRGGTTETVLRRPAVEWFSHTRVVDALFGRARITVVDTKRLVDALSIVRIAPGILAWLDSLTFEMPIDAQSKHALC